jgi:outer membrane protein assembly factor BamD (BamD/ComL family)
MGKTLKPKYKQLQPRYIEFNPDHALINYIYYMALKTIPNYRQTIKYTKSQLYTHLLPITNDKLKNLNQFVNYSVTLTPK